MKELVVISESERNGSQASVFVEARDADILALLGRRPCTLNDIAVGIGLHPSEVAKNNETPLRRRQSHRAASRRERLLPVGATEG